MECRNCLPPGVQVESYIVYMHISPDGKIYIGITCQAPELRWRKGKGYKDNDYFYRVINKYGWDNFRHIILADGLTKEEAESMEIRLIKESKANEKKHGFNLESGGNVRGKVSAESRLKMSISSTGKKHTEETKRKISEGGRGLKKSEETRRRMSLSQLSPDNPRRGRNAKNAKPLLQLSIDGAVIQKFRCSYEAEKQTGAKSRSIRRACVKGFVCGGYRWRFA